MYHFQSLQDVSVQRIAQCFNESFSDYEQPICFTAESLTYYLTASRVDLSLSFGAFCGEQMVAFILNAGGMYQGQQAVFDAGTGVVPEHRGRKVFSGLFAYTVRQLQQRGIASYYLEALQSNHHAVSIYRKKGFFIRREYSVLTASGPKGDWDSRVAAVPFEAFEAFPTEFSVEPSFEHTLYAVNQNPQLYEVLYLENMACCIYAKKNGEIIQMHYQELDALKEVMTALTARYPRAMAKNVDLCCRDVIRMLTQIGFVEITRQYEMARDI